MRGRGRLPLIALACLGLGLVLTVPFERWFTLLFGVGFLLAFVVCGVFAIASPAFLEREDDDEVSADDGARRRRGGRSAHR
jgi:uncharacterized protein (DUF58 family)